jgi:hypothetical protein
MVTEEALRLRYKEMTVIDLLEIVANKGDYTEIAISVAIHELRNRNVSEDEIKNYHSVIAARWPDALTDNNTEDLNLLQKVMFYFLWIPRLRRLFTNNFLPNSYVLKQQQASYYSIAGFCILLLSRLSLRNNSASIFIEILIAGFAPVYIFDIIFNKSRQIREMEKKVAQKKACGGKIIDRNSIFPNTTPMGGSPYSSLVVLIFL